MAGRTPPSRYASIALLSSSNEKCPDLMMAATEDSTGLFLSVYDNDAGTLVREFEVGSHGVDFQFSRTFADGGYPQRIADATGGTLVFTQADVRGMKGTFDIAFGDAGTLSGTFSAPTCGPF